MACKCWTGVRSGNATQDVERDDRAAVTTDPMSARGKRFASQLSTASTASTISTISTIITSGPVRTGGMPVSIDAFESDDSLDEPSIGERVVAHLAGNSDKAFKRGEIAAAIDADPNAVGSSLTRLKRRDLVRHREQYWAITDDRERLRGAYDLRRLLSNLANDEDEAFDREAWLKNATPVEESRDEGGAGNESG